MVVVCAHLIDPALQSRFSVVKRRTGAEIGFLKVKLLKELLKI